MAQTIGTCRDCGAPSQFPYGNYCEAHRNARYGRTAGRDFWRNKAVAYVHTAIRQGVLPKLDGAIACVDCGLAATAYEHRDYMRPLDVEPVCRECNRVRGAAAIPSADRYSFAKLTT